MSGEQTHSIEIEISDGKDVKHPFRKFDILIANKPPTFKRTWNFVYEVTDNNDSVTLSLLELRVSKFAPLRWLELKIFRKLLTNIP